MLKFNIGTDSTDQEIVIYAGIYSKQKRVGKLTDYELFSYCFCIVNCFAINLKYSILYLIFNSDAASFGRSSRLSISVRLTTEINSSKITSSMAVPCVEIDLSSTIIGETKSDPLLFQDNDISFFSTPLQVLDASLIVSY